MRLVHNQMLPIIRSVFILLVFFALGVLVQGCAVVEIKEAPSYRFSRSILNIAVLEPVVRGGQQGSVKVATRAQRVERRSAPPRAARSSVPDRPRIRTLLPKSSSVGSSAPRCTGTRCSEPKLVTAARRLFGLRMKDKHAFIQHVARVSDVVVKPGTNQSYPDALLAHIRSKGSFQAGGKPRAGDLVFFHGTTSGKPQKGHNPSLVGVVERVDSNGTVFFITQMGNVVDRSRATPSRPHVRRDETTGKVLNSFLRNKRRGDGQDTAYMAGELLLGFGRI